MPTMGNPAVAGSVGGADVFGGDTLAGLVRRRVGEDFFFMRLSFALEHGSFGSG